MGEVTTAKIKSEETYPRIHLLASRRTPNGLPVETLRGMLNNWGRFHLENPG